MKNVVELIDSATLEEQARAWLIRLDGNEPLTADEKARLRAWLQRSPAHRAELQRLSRFWQSANVLTELAVPLQGARRSRSRGALAFAASALVIFILAAAWWSLTPQDISSGSFVTAIGEQKTLVLADGSSLQLNTDSQVQVSYEPMTRRVRLVRGEAYFNVAADADRPFEVHTPMGVVRAIGTAFIVRIDGSRLDVAVSEGKVEVRAARATAVSALPARVSAGQVAELTSEQPPHVEPVSPSELAQRSSWQEGFLVFAGEPLGEVIAELNRYSTTTITMAQPQLASLAVGGRFRIGDLDAFIDVLETQFDVRATPGDGDTIRLDVMR